MLLLEAGKCLPSTLWQTGMETLWQTGMADRYAESPSRPSSCQPPSLATQM